MLMKLHDSFGINKHMSYIFHRTVANYKHFLKNTNISGKTYCNKFNQILGLGGKFPRFN